MRKVNRTGVIAKTKEEGLYKIELNRRAAWALWARSLNLFFECKKERPLKTVMETVRLIEGFGLGIQISVKNVSNSLQFSLQAFLPLFF